MPDSGNGAAGIALLLLHSALLLRGAAGLDNGLALLPPRVTPPPLPSPLFYPRGPPRFWPSGQAAPPPPPLPAAGRADTRRARRQAWRSWNAFHENFNQTTIRETIDALVAKSNSVDGVPTSLKDLGYDMVGIDEGWEGCGLGADGTQHYANGTPAVRPDL